MPTSDTSPIRFAPSTTGYAHPGTLMSALLCWLDARSRGARFILRLENIDPERSRAEYERAMQDDLEWFGIDWDELHHQHHHTPRHEKAIDHLEAAGLLYPCACTRSRLKRHGHRAPDGGFAYDNACRNRRLPAAGWRACVEPLRVRLPEEEIHLTDEGGFTIRQAPATEMGDPVVRRRDGAIAYHLACVVDDRAAGITRLIRGRDLAPSAPVQILLHRMLGYPPPSHRHHFLLLEKHGGKLAKFHGAVGAPQLREVYSARELCGLLAHWCGLLAQPESCLPGDLKPFFDWNSVRKDDLVVHWDGRHLSVGP